MRKQIYLVSRLQPQSDILPQIEPISQSTRSKFYALEQFLSASKFETAFRQQIRIYQDLLKEGKVSLRRVLIKSVLNLSIKFFQGLQFSLQNLLYGSSKARIFMRTIRFSFILTFVLISQITSTKTGCFDQFVSCTISSNITSLLVLKIFSMVSLLIDFLNISDFCLISIIINLKLAQFFQMTHTLISNINIINIKNNQFNKFQYMFNRLVADNILKTPIKTDPYFAINKKMLAYSIESSLKIKSFQKDAKQLQLILEESSKVKTFQLSKKKTWLYAVTSNNILLIYNIDKEWKLTKIFQIMDVQSIQENMEVLVLKCTNDFVRVFSLTQIEQKVNSNIKKIKSQELNTLTQSKNNIKIIKNNEGKDVFIQSTNQNKKQQKIVTIFSQRKINKIQRVLEMDYLKNPIAIYKDRYIFDYSTGTHQVEIYDVHQAKIKGKFIVEGQFRFAQIKQNLLILVMNVENTDYYWCFLLNQNPSQNSTLITHRVVYQKGRGDYYGYINMLSTETGAFLSKKKDLVLYLDNEPQKLNNNTCSMIFILAKQKQKTQIVKLDHAKILQSPFFQQKVNKIVASKTVQNKINQQKTAQQAQNDRARIHSTIQHANGHRTIEQTQKKFVEMIVDTKLKVILRKFNELEKRVQQLENTMKGIYEKIDSNLKNLNRQQIKQSVQSLFQKLTPQFQKYFSQLFKQVSGVLDQGVSFYNKKMAMQAQIHKQALSQIVDRTFDSTEQIIRLSKKQEKLSEKTEDQLKKLLEAKKKWIKRTDEFEDKSKQLATSTGNNIKGVIGNGGGDKIFVRADLNAGGAKKQT